MAFPMNRREFLAASAGATAALACGLESTAAATGPFKHALHKAVIVGKPTADVLRPIQEAGFEGVEAGIVSPAEAAEARQVAAGLGLRIHSVLRGWAQFNSDDPQEVESTLATTVEALRAAQAYGAGAVLLVPGRIDGHPRPEPWEFQVKFDRKTGHLTQVVAEGNERYQAYIEAHNRAYEAFQKAIRQLIPVAREVGVVLAIENVWNNLFVDPTHFAHFIDSFRSRWVKVYFDLANHVPYAPTERWIAILGRRIVRCHVKDFKLNPDGHGGQFVDIRDGSINWPVVRQALDRVGYRGWMTIEGSEGLSLEERSRRLDLIIAGQ
jgi:hexulose-6-phosphate isomerase